MAEEQVLHPLGSQLVEAYMPIFGSFEPFSLPKEVIFDIFVALPLRSLQVCVRVNQVWRFLLGSLLFDPLTYNNQLKRRFSSLNEFQRLSHLVSVEGCPVERAAEVLLSLLLSQKRLTEFEYTYVSTNFAIKQICLENMQIGEVKSVTYPHLLHSTITSAQHCTRFNWWVHNVVHPDKDESKARKKEIIQNRIAANLQLPWYKKSVS